MAEPEGPLSPYFVALSVHSAMRWVALAAGAGATISTFRASDPTTTWVNRWGLFLIIALDLQLVIGLLLYFFISPVTMPALMDFARTLRNPWLRFFAIDHVVIMVAAVIFAHVGRIRARSATAPEARLARLRLWFALALVAMIAATPWPGLVAGRPLFRMWTVERE